MVTISQKDFATRSDEYLRGFEAGAFAAEDALERIALLDEADGHELTAEHAQQAVAIATAALGQHPSEVLVNRTRRKQPR